MSDAWIGLIGVFIGGIIGSIGTIYTLRIQYIQWKKQLKYDYLIKKRANIIQVSEDFLTKLHELANEDSSFYDYERYLSSTMILKLPKNNVDNFTSEVATKYPNDDDIKDPYEYMVDVSQIFLRNIENGIKELDKEIDKIFD